MQRFETAVAVVLRALRVLDRSAAVDTDRDRKSMLAQELEILIRQQSGVGGHREAHVEIKVFSLVFGVSDDVVNQAAVDERLAAKEADGDRLRRVCGGEEAIHGRARHDGVHRLRLATVERPSVRIAVGARQIASRAYVEGQTLRCRLGNKIKGILTRGRGAQGVG